MEAMTGRNGFDHTVRCYALPDGRCTHIDCPKKHLSAARGVLSGM